MGESEAATAQHQDCGGRRCESLLLDLLSVRAPPSESVPVGLFQALATQKHLRRAQKKDAGTGSGLVFDFCESHLAAAFVAAMLGAMDEQQILLELVFHEACLRSTPFQNLSEPLHHDSMHPGDLLCNLNRV